MSEPAKDARPETAPTPRAAAKPRLAPARGSRRWAKLLRRGLLLVLALGAIGIGVMAWLPKPVPVELAMVQRGPLRVTVDEEGRTRVKDRYIVSAPLLATLMRIALSPGAPVEPGTVLARLLPLASPLLDPRTRAQAEARVAAANATRRQAYAALDRIRSALQFAEREAERQRGLLERGATARVAVERAELEVRSLREELASAQFGARVAEHDLETARAALGRLSGDADAREEQLELVSPVDGLVLRVIQESEGVVQPGTPLLELGDPAALEIVVDVLTSDAVDIEPGAPVLIERWGGDRPLHAHVRAVEPSAFTRVSALGVEEQRVNVIIDLDEPREMWDALGDGFRVEARITVWQGEDVLSVPASAVFRQAGAWAVFRVRDGYAQLVPVEVGHRNPERVQVERGLSAGDAIVSHPGDRLGPGVRVEPL